VDRPLVFGVSEGAIFISLVAAIARWFSRSGIALATAIFLCLARVGSFSLDTSPSWARSLYDAGWQPPLWLGAAITAAGLVAAVIFRLLDAAHAPPMSTRPVESGQINCGDLDIRPVVLVHPRPARPVRGGLLPFRQTYAIEYLQHVKAHAAAGRQCEFRRVCGGSVRNTLFGLLADRFGRRAMMLTVGTLLLPITFVVLSLTNLTPWASTVLMGVSFSLVPAIIWPATTLIVEPRRLGTALGVITLLQNVGLWVPTASPAGWPQGRCGCGEPRGLRHNDLVLRSAEPCGPDFSAAPVAARERPKGHGLEVARVSRRRAWERRDENRLPRTFASEFVCFVRLTTDTGAVGWARRLHTMPTSLQHLPPPGGALGARADALDIDALIVRVEEREHKFPAATAAGHWPASILRCGTCAAGSKASP